MSDDSSPHIEYASVAELLTEYKNYMKDPVNVELGANYLLNSLIDETILGVVFEVHHAYKTGSNTSSDDVEGQTSDEQQQNQLGITDIPDINVFGPVNSKKSFDCKCPNCDRLVAAQRFAPHLEKCMGMGRNSSRIASRRIANSRDNYYGNFFSDDDDEDWLSEKRRKKHPALRANGTRKNGMKKTS